MSEDVSQRRYQRCCKQQPQVAHLLALFSISQLCQVLAIALLTVFICWVRLQAGSTQSMFLSFYAQLT